MALPKKIKARRKFVAYYRVSTNNQHNGIDAQKEIVKKYLKQWWPPIASFKEEKSGKVAKNRPELQKALALCKKENATLIVAKLDRLSRDAEFIFSIQKSRIKFIVAEMPEANDLTIGILAVLAQHESKLISDRTKAALAIVKKKKPLGFNNPKVKKGLKKHWKKLRIEREKKISLLNKKERKNLKEKKTQRELSDKAVFPMIKTFRKQGMSFDKIAEALNDSGVATRQGKVWHRTSVTRVYKRCSFRGK